MYYTKWTKVEDTVTYVDAAWEWVNRHLGDPGPHGLWWYADGYYYFKRGRDATLYLLTWASSDDNLKDYNADTN